MTFERRLREARARGGADPVAQLHAMCEEYLRFAEHEAQRYRLMFGGLRDVGATARDTGEAGAVVSGSMGMASFHLLADTVRACARQAGSEESDSLADATALWVGLHGFALLRLSNPEFPWPEGLLRLLQERLPGVQQTSSTSGAA